MKNFKKVLAVMFAVMEVEKKTRKKKQKRVKVE